jgi:hypothetical protein
MGTKEWLDLQSNMVGLTRSMAWLELHSSQAKISAIVHWSHGTSWSRIPSPSGPGIVHSVGMAVFVDALLLAWLGSHAPWLG